ncbi:hypothetical protein BT96DRAFT_754847, partial [Gymnopus androsaceus JB14]
DSLICHVYSQVQPDAQFAPPAEYFLDCAILAPRNADVSTTNVDVLSRFPGEEYIFFSQDK